MHLQMIVLANGKAIPIDTMLISVFVLNDINDEFSQFGTDKSPCIDELSRQLKYNNIPNLQVASIIE